MANRLRPRRIFAVVVDSTRSGLDHLRDYATNCTVAGVNYIANVKLLAIERLFWLACVVSCAVGAYLVITEYERNFESTAVSIVYESLPPNQRVHFASIAVCDAPIPKEENQRVMDFVDSMEPGGENYDVEAFLFLVMFPSTHTQIHVRSFCGKYRNTSGAHCPETGYRQLADQLMLNCTEYFVACSFLRQPFECCRYFKAYTSSYGKCYLLNSLLNNSPGSESWLDLSMNPITDIGEMSITTARPMNLFVINDVDLPMAGFPAVNVKLNKPGRRMIEFALEYMVNDPDVREISPLARNCRFPDEVLPGYRYPLYSFTTCYAECLRSYQIKFCNCSLYNFLPHEDGSIPDCGYDGFACVDRLRLVQPDPRSLLPWAPTTPCNCLPSCTEVDFRTVYDPATLEGTKNARQFSTTLLVPDMPTHRYRRQALRTRLDVVVTIGGILGLFMGVSILSGIELIYYFTVRVCGDRRLRRAAHQRRTAAEAARY